MKKLLGIVVLCLLICNKSFTDNQFNPPKDVASGNKYNKSLEKNFKKHGVQVVDKKDGHPVRAGNKSLRFEVRPEDCGYDDSWNDCKKDRERHELSGKSMSKGKWWYAWSIYLPEDYINIYSSKTALGQFHQHGGHPVFMFNNLGGGYWVSREILGDNTIDTQILTREKMIGRWTDVLVNVKWSKKNNGFFKVWINNKPVYDYKGQTKTEEKTYFKFGIYRSFMSRYLNYHNLSPEVEECFKKNGASANQIYKFKKRKKMNSKLSYKIYNKCKHLYKITKVPAQIVYYDEVRVGKTRKKVVGNLPPLK